MNHAAATIAPEQPQLRSSLSAEDRQRFGLEGGMLGIKNRILGQCVKEISRRSYVIYYIYYVCIYILYYIMLYYIILYYIILYYIIL